MKIVFMGTPDFAVPSLIELIKHHEVSAVLTQPDRPKGRGNKITMSPVKKYALENGITVYQPEKLRTDGEVLNKIKDIQPDFIVVVAFGQILPKEVLDIPKYACINLHASLLPKYRGAAPINWAIINGEKMSGNTTMLMNEGLDTGDILLTQEVEILDEMTAGELHDILMCSGASLLLETIDKLSKEDLVPVKQDNSRSCYASMLSKEIAKIDWKETSINIKNLIRGLNPWPIAYTTYKDEVMKIYEAETLDEDSEADPGTILEVSQKGIKAATKEGNLLIKTIQFPGGKPLKVEQYLRGNSIENGIILGR